MKFSRAITLVLLVAVLTVGESINRLCAQMTGSTSPAPTLLTTGTTPSPQQAMEAVAQAREKVMEHPGDAMGWLDLGKALQAAGASPESGEAFNKALSLNPNLSEAWSGIGHLAAAQEKWWLAAKDFRQAVSSGPKGVSAHFFLGQMLLRVGDFSEAVTEFDVVLHRNPQLCCYCAGPDRKTDCGPVALFCYVGQGQAFMQQGKMAEAEKKFQKALGLNPNYPDALISKGQIFLQNHEPAKAMKAFDTALRARPESLPAINGRATALRESGNSAQAKEEFAKARVLFQRKELRLRAEFENNRGLRLWRQGNLHEAADAFRLATAKAPDYAPAHDNLGSVLSLLGDDHGAVKEFAAAVSAEPTYAKAHDNWGIVLLRDGDVDGAIDQFRAALAERPGDAAAHLNLGVALARKGQKGKAKSQLRLAIELDPAMAKAHIELGLLLASPRGKLSHEARAQIEEGLRLNPLLKNLLPEKIAAEFP